MRWRINQQKRLHCVLNQDIALSKTLANEPEAIEEKVVEKALRPKLLEEFSGQRKIVDNLQIFIQAAKQRGDALDHVLLHGPPGLGKTTLSHIITNEIGANLKLPVLYLKNQVTSQDCSPTSSPVMCCLLTKFTA